MKRIPLHIEISEENPAYLWAKKQSDSVNAMGHIGTHLDCYTKVPVDNAYKLDVAVFDCRNLMPVAKDFDQHPLQGKAVLLFTDTLNTKGYGGTDYGAANTFFTQDALDALLRQSPAFILIDGCGIGNHGEEHQRFDKQCEMNGCFVIENVLLTEDVVRTVKKIDIRIDLETPSTGKRCDVFALCGQ
ncbi:hypothetical protein [uncultured Pseudodesulfovibrio sp.]|uniref:hypothetical protein n=1 Tax=uncultured Pseudodesulfovibrio sp. TaxID=2035858 RepID=UPI0029C824DF|nr:hypothetical protein [uncultured Pseudodesulfovibrio sp.]